MKALAFETFGGPDVLQYLTLTDPELLPGTVRLRMQAVGLNFADLYRRRGNYVLEGSAPYILGYEGVGVIESLADDVTGFKVGELVGFADSPRANATLVRVPANHLIALPEKLTPVDAAALLLQGLTAQYLCEDSISVVAGQHVAVHAAAGGVGRLLLQMCKAKGAIVHAIVSTPAKALVAESCGADATHLSGGDWSQRLRTTGGGMDVVFDSIGTTLQASLTALRPRGRVVLFGLSGGEPVAFPPRDLMERSTGVIGGDLWDYLDSAQARQSRAAKLFDALASGVISLPPIETFALADGASAHRRLEGRDLIGKIVLIPEAADDVR